MTRTVLVALLGHWRRRPVQFVTLILGLALATALWSGVQAINAEARQSYDRAAAAVGGDGAAYLTGPNGTALAFGDYVALRKAGWRVAPLMEGWVETPNGRVRLLGFDPLTPPPASAAAVAVLSGNADGFLDGEGQLLAHPTTADRLSGAPGLPPVRPVEALAPGLAFADITIAARLLETTDLTRLILLPAQPLRRPALADVLPLAERRTPETAEDLGRLTDSFHLNLTAFGLLSFAVGLFIVNGAIGLAFEQRRPLFRTLRAIGVPGSTLVVLLAVELLLFALVAGAIGIALGYLIAAVLLPDVAATLRGLYGATVEGALTLSPVWWLGGLAVAVLGTAVAGAQALWKLARLPVLAGAQPRAWARVSRSERWRQAALAAGLAIIAVVLALSGGGLLAGFALLGTLLIAAALALPPVLAGALALGASFARRPLTEWFWADTRQQLPGLSLALMALLLALAANIGVGTMVQSFRATFTGWLDQRLASEIYVSLEDAADLPRLETFLDGRVSAILPIWDTERDVLGAPAEIFGVVDHPTYRDNWPMLDAVPDVWGTLFATPSVLINEQLARREDLGPGDSLPLPDGPPVTIAGIYSDYGNPRGQVIIDNTRLLQRFDDIDQRRFGLRVAPEAVGPLRDDLSEDFGLPPDNIVDQAALKAFSLEVFERTFAVTGALNVLTLGVAGLAILTSLLTLAAMRLPQLAPVWAMGLTRKRLAGLEMLRALLLAVLTFLAAIPVGLVLAWVLLAVINVDAFGWRLPMLLFPKDWISLLILSLLAAGLAALWPALRLARIPPADLIRVFAHER